MDTTHTFQTRVSELTISPMSFSAITDIAIGGALIPFDVGYCHLSEGARGQYVRDLVEILTDLEESEECGTVFPC